MQFPKSHNLPKVCIWHGLWSLNLYDADNLRGQEDTPFAGKQGMICFSFVEMYRLASGCLVWMQEVYSVIQAGS